MPKEIECPDCGTAIKTWGKKNPLECGKCKKTVNVVTRGVSLRIQGLEIEEESDRIIIGFSRVGQIFMSMFFRKLQEFYLVPKEKGVCSLCQTEKNLTMENVKDGKKYCSACGKDLFGVLRTENLPVVKGNFSDLKKTYTDKAFEVARGMFWVWVDANWGKILRQDAFKRKFHECKGRVAEINPDETSDLEEWEIRKIRKIWSQIRAPMSILKFFELYRQDRKISKKNRKKRSLRLGELRDESGTYTRLALKIADPICRECEYLTEHDWGFECDLDKQRKKSAKPDRLPHFPTSKINLPNKSYIINTEETVESITFKASKKADWKTAEVLGADWLNEYYDTGTVFKDNTRYPDILRINRPDNKYGTAYYFVYPVTEVVPVISGDWEHTVAYGPTTTCVISARKATGEKKVKFFRHDENVAIKNYYAEQRANATRGYFKKARVKEQRKIKLLLHKESRLIADYLEDKLGKVAVLNFKKTQYVRETDERKGLNQKLSHWNDSIFRSLVKYKLELLGLAVKEKEFSTTELAICPYCQAETGGNWQDIIITQNKNGIKCLNCGKDTNAMLAIGLNISNNLNNLSGAE